VLTIGSHAPPERIVATALRFGPSAEVTTFDNLLASAGVEKVHSREMPVAHSFPALVSAVDSQLLRSDDTEINETAMQ